jgi:Calcineurin-like phosphoesterase
MKKESEGFKLTRREFVIASGVAVTASACDNDTATHVTDDGGVDADVDEDTGDIIGDGDTDSGEDENVAPPPERPITTVKETIRGTLLETQQIEDLRSVFGKTETASGEPHIERDDLDAAGTSTGAAAEASSLAYFVQLTDIHLTDEESPARSIHSPIAEASAWRPQEIWSTQTLDSAMATINDFAEIRPMDFVIFSGDIIDNKHFIEMKWFIDIVEGNTINPDTGDDDDPRAQGLLDPHDPFEAAGLHPDVNWYATQGNHDLLILGNFDSLDLMIADPTGDKATILISDNATPTCFTDHIDPDACIDGFCYSDTPDRCFIPANDTYYQTRDVVPDANRHIISSEEWIAMVMESTTHLPLGHGFTNDNITNETAYWRDDSPIENSPIALVGLDMSTTGVTSSSTGSFSSEKLQWLKDTLDDLASQNKLIIIISHHCSRDIGGNDTDTFREALNNCPNVLLHITGHHHTNEVMTRPAPEGLQPWHGYYEIQTSGLLDFPQQMRFFEVVDKGDGTGIIYSTMVNIKMDEGDKAEASRFYCLVNVQEGRGRMGLGEPEDRNVALRVAWPPSMIPILANLPQRDIETLHFIPEDL